MDNVTHTLVGVGMAKAGLSKKYGAGATWVLAIASNLPDLDVFWGFVHSGESFEYRRMLTHSLFGFPLLALLAASIFKKIFKAQSFSSLFQLTMVGMAVHVFFDLVNSFGVVLLYPFSRSRYELAWIFIIDLLLLSLLLMPVLLSKIPSFKVHQEKVFRWFKGLVAIYVLTCGLSRMRAQVILKSWVHENNLHPSFSYVFPEALGAHRFRGVVRENNIYTMHLINTVKGSIEESRTFVTEETDEDAQKISTTTKAQQLLWFAKAPVWQKEEGTSHWKLFDLRFVSMVIGRGIPFVFRFQKNEERIEFLGK